MNYFYFYIQICMNKLYITKNYIVAFGYCLYNHLFCKQNDQDNDKEDILKEFENTDIDVDYEEDLKSILALKKVPETQEPQEPQKEFAIDSDSDSDSENLSYEMVSESPEITESSSV